MVKKTTRITERVSVKVKRLIALTALCMGMFTTTAFAFVTDYDGKYGNATLQVTTANGLKRAIAETVPYTSRGCYFGRVKVTTVYRDGSENEIYKVSGRGGRAYYDSGFEDAEDYTSLHEFYDYFNENKLDSWTVSKS